MTYSKKYKKILVTLLATALLGATSWYMVMETPYFPGLKTQMDMQIINLQIHTEFEVKGNELWMNKKINSKTHDQVKRILADNPQIDTLVLEEVPGTTDLDIMTKLSYLVREKGLKTKLRSHSRVASGGVDLFLAGVERTMERGAHVGVHSWGDGFSQAIDYPREAPEHEENRKYVEDMLGKDDFYWFTVEAAPYHEMHEMSEDEIIQYGLLTEPIRPYSKYRDNNGDGSEAGLMLTPGILLDKLVAIHQGGGDIFLYTQGGPSPVLIVEEAESILDSAGLNTGDNNTIAVDQAHTYAPYKFVDPITFEQAIDTNKRTTEILVQAVEFFKQTGRDVYVVGTSYGAFLVQDLIATQGVVADGYLVAAGRLDMPEEVWKEFSEGNYVGFEHKDDGNFVVRTFNAEEAGMGGSGSVSDQNMAKIAAGVAHKRYTDLLKDTDLSKVVYAFGTKDEQVGPLSEAEIKFLRAKNAQVFSFDESDHGTAIDQALELDFVDLIHKKASGQ